MARKVETSLALDTSSAVQSASKLIENLKAIKKTVDELAKSKISFEIPQNLKELYKLKTEITKENEKQIKQEEKKNSTQEKELTDYQKLLKIKKDYINTQSSSILNTVNSLSNEKDKVQKISEELKKLNAEMRMSSEIVNKNNVELTKTQELHLKTKKIMQDAKDEARKIALEQSSGITDAIEKQKKFNEVYKQQFKDVVKKEVKQPSTETIINKDVREKALEVTKSTMGASFDLKDTATQKEYLKNLAEQKKSLITLEQKETAELIKKKMIQDKSDTILANLKAEGYEKEKLISKHKEELDAYKATLQVKKEKVIPPKEETMASVSKQIRATAFEKTQQILPTTDKTSVDFQAKYNEILKSMLPAKEKELSIEQQINAEIRKKALDSALLINADKNSSEFKKAYLSELEKEKNSLKSKKDNLTEFQKLEREARERAKQTAYEKTKNISDELERYKQYKAELANILKIQKESVETTSKVTKPAGTNYLAEMNKQMKQQAYDKTKAALPTTDDKSTEFLKEYNKQLKLIKDSAKENKDIKKEASKEEKDTYNNLLKQQKQEIWNRIQSSNATTDNKEKMRLYREEVAKLGQTADKEREKKPIELFSDVQQMTGVFNQIKSFLTSYIVQTMELENAVYNLGVVTGKSSLQFAQIKNEMLDMSRSLPYSAKELAKVIETLSRTGRSYEESKTIIQSVSKLAMATGDDLASTANIVTKIFTALNIDAKDTDKVLNSLHSTALMTATDMGSLGEAYKNVGASLSSFTEITTKSGQELTDYKQELIEFGNVALGVFANMGKSASNSGVLVRNLTTKMIALEKTGKNMLKQDIEGKVFFKVDDKGEVSTTFEKNVEGYKELTVDALQSLAKEDLPEAVELFAKLYKEGLIRTETMMKIFTVRQGQATASLFSTMGEGYDELNAKINHSRSVQEDYEKQLDNINNKLKIFNNSATAVFKEMGTSIMESFNTTISVGITLLDVLNSINNKSKEIGGTKNGVVDFLSTVAASGGRAVATIVAVSYAIKGLKAVIAGAGIMSGVTLAITGAIMVVDFLLNDRKKLLKQEKELIENAKLQSKQLAEAELKYKNLSKSIEVTKNEIKQFNNVSNLGMSGFDRFTLSLDSFMEKVKEVKNVVEKSDIFNKLINEKAIKKDILKIEGLFNKVQKFKEATQNVKLSNSEILELPDIFTKIQDYKPNGFLEELQNRQEFKITNEITKLNDSVAILQNEAEKAKLKLDTLSETKLAFYASVKVQQGVEEELRKVGKNFNDFFTKEIDETYKKFVAPGIEKYNFKDVEFFFEEYDNINKKIDETKGIFSDGGWLAVDSTNYYIQDFIREHRIATTEYDKLKTSIQERNNELAKIEEENLKNVKKYLDEITLSFTEVQSAIEQAKLQVVLEKVNNMDFKNIDDFGNNLKEMNFEGFEQFSGFGKEISNVFKGLDEDTFKKIFKDADIKANVIALKSLNDTINQYGDSIDVISKKIEEYKSKGSLTETEKELVKTLGATLEKTILAKTNTEALRDTKLEVLDISIKQTNTETNLKDVLYKILNITNLTKQKQIELAKLRGVSLDDIKEEAKLKKDLLNFELSTSKENKANLIEQVASSSKLLSILNANRVGSKKLSQMSYEDLKAQYEKIDALKNGNKINTKTNELRKILLAILNEEDKIRANAIDNVIVEFNTAKETYELKKKIRDLEIEIQTTQNKLKFDKKIAGYKIDVKYLQDIYNQNEKIKKLREDRKDVYKNPNLSLKEKVLKANKINLEIASTTFDTSKMTSDFKEKMNESFKNFNLSIPLDFDEQILNKAKDNFQEALKNITDFISKEASNFNLEVNKDNFKNVLKILNDKNNLSKEELTLKNELIKLLGLEKDFNEANDKVNSNKVEYTKKLLSLQKQLDYSMSKSPQFVKDIMQNRDTLENIMTSINETINDKNLTKSQINLKIAELNIEHFNAENAIKNLKNELKKAIEENKFTLKYKDDMFGAGAVEQAQNELNKSTEAFESFTYDTNLTHEENLLIYENLKTEEAVKQYKLELAKTEASKKNYEQLKSGLSFIATALQGTGAGAGLETALNTMNLMGSIQGGYAAATAEGVGFLGAAGGYAQMIGAGMQLGNMLMYGEAEKELAQAQAEYQKNSEQLDKYRNKLLEQQNGIMGEFVNQATKIGIDRAVTASLKSVSNITGAGSTEYTKSVKTGIGKSKDTTVSKIANVSLKDLGYDISDMKTVNDLMEARSVALQKMSEGQAKVNRLANVPKFGFDKDTYEQARADLLAYIDLYHNLDDIIEQTTTNLNEIYKSYFGATLNEIKDDSGKITSYVSDWNDFIGNINEDIVKSFTASGSAITSITSNLFTGLRNSLVQNNKDVIDTTDNIIEIFEGIATNVSKGMDLSSSSVKALVKEFENLKATQEELSQTSAEFISQYLKNGGLVSDVYAELDTGSKIVYDSIKTSFSASNFEDLTNNLGKSLFDNVFESFYEQSINEQYASQILALSAKMTEAMKSGSINSLSTLSQEAQALSLKLEQDRQSYNALRSLYEYDKNIEYTSENQNITYDTGTSTQTVYNYYVTTNLDIGVGIGTSEEWDYVGERITDKVIDSMQYDKGYDLGRLK